MTDEIVTPPEPASTVVPPVPTEREQALVDRVAELQAELEAARQPVAPASVATVVTAADVPPLVKVPPAERVALPPALSSGSAGPAVAELATLLELLGVETYLSRGDNPHNVLDDELMAAVRRVLSNHHSSTADPVELPQLLRDVASLDAIQGDTWAILREKAAAA